MSTRGIVSPQPSYIAVQQMDGTQTRLAFRSADHVLQYLDGELIEVRGRRSFGRLHVSDWRLLESRSGLPVWLGVLEQRGRELLLFDHNTQSWLTLEDNVVEELFPYRGKPVLVEGFSDSLGIIHVEYYQILVEGED